MRTEIDLKEIKLDGLMMWVWRFNTKVRYNMTKYFVYYDEYDEETLMFEFYANRWLNLEDLNFFYKKFKKFILKNASYFKNCLGDTPKQNVIVRIFLKEDNIKHPMLKEIILF